MQILTKRSYHTSILLIITLALATLVASCASPTTPQVVSKSAVTPTATETAPESDAVTELTPDLVGNGVFEIPTLGTITLIGGKYEQRYGEGASQVNKVGLFRTAIGDLDSDGSDEAAVVLWWEGSGSATFLYLAVVDLIEGAPQQTSIMRLGDRIRVETLGIAGGEMVLEMITHSPNDALCCPKQQEVQTYALRGAELARTSRRIIGEEAPPAEMVGMTWYWTRYADMAGVNDIPVTGPNYTLTLLADGSFQLLVDCNRASGTYTVSGSQITIQVGPITRAFCGEDSLHDQFLRMLGDVVTFVMDGDQLVLNLKMDAGNMIFDLEAPSTLAGTSWQWTKTGDGSDVADPGSYTLTFNADGSVAIKADCNRAFGGYTVSGDALTFGALGMTRAMCRPGSLDGQFVRELGSASAYALVEGALVLTTDAGVMTFVAYDPLAGTSWQWTKTGDGSDVADPGSYTLTFNADGSVAIKADCNRAFGGYTVSGDALTFGALGMTRAMCRPGSLDGQFVRELGSASAYALVDGALVLTIEGGEMVLMPHEPLLGVTWQWVKDADGTDVSDPARYNFNLAADGTVAIKADCNRASGSYVLDGEALSIRVGPMTLAECGPGSRYNEFVRQLGLTESFSLEENGALLLRLSGGAELSFVQGQAN